MSENNNSGSTLITGLILGAALGAGVTFLFGTKKGKQIRLKIRDAYPEFFDQLDDVLVELKDSLGDRYEQVEKEIRKIEKAASETIVESEAGLKETVTNKITDIGQEVEDLGVKIQHLTPSTDSSKRFFKKGTMSH